MDQMNLFKVLSSNFDVHVDTIPFIHYKGLSDFDLKNF